MEMALGPENLAYMILNEKGQFHMALHLVAIGKKTKSSLKKIESDTMSPSSHLLLCLLI